MKITTTFLTASFLASLLLGASVNVHAQTSGMVRDRLVGNATKTCIEKQRAERPATVTDASIDKFCECNATYLADKMSNDEVMAMRGTDKKIDPALIAAANKSCEATITK
jgi:hypothetical protein